MTRGGENAPFWHVNNRNHEVDDGAGSLWTYLRVSFVRIFQNSPEFRFPENSPYLWIAKWSITWTGHKKQGQPKKRSQTQTLQSIAVFATVGGGGAAPKAKQQKACVLGPSRCLRQSEIEYMISVLFLQFIFYFSGTNNTEHTIIYI